MQVIQEINRARTAFKSCNTKSSRAKYIQVVYITDISRAAQDRVVLKLQDNNQVAHPKIKSWILIKSCGEYKSRNLHLIDIKSCK